MTRKTLELKGFEGIHAQTVEVSLWRYEQLLKKEALYDKLTEDKELTVYAYVKGEIQDA